jgi:hypothetical protein
MRKHLSWLGACAALLGLAGCGDRQHLTPNFGRSFQDAQIRQAANPNGAPAAKNVKGLDSQEAAIVSGTLRRQMAPPGAQVADQSMLLVAPQGPKQDGSYLPPPSVPAERR